MKTKTLLSTAVLLALGTLAGCGGGSSGGATRIGGSQVTGVISAIDTPAQAGVVAGAASGGNTQVTVDNVTYTLDDNVNIQVENAAGDASALAEGQVVTMETAADGSGQNLVTAVSLADEVEGVVFGDVTASGMNVMGLNVTFTETTKFEWDDRSTPADPAELGQGWVVEVHGFPSDTGIVATRIEVKSSDYQTYNDEFELKGTISSATATAIQIGSQSIMVETGTDVSDMPANIGDWTNLYVEVKTDADNVDPAAGTITATKIEREERDTDRSGHDDDDDEVEIEGVLDYDGGVVKINGEVINVSDSISRDTLTWFDGKLVEVEGRYVNGELVIYEIELED